MNYMQIFEELRYDKMKASVENPGELTDMIRSVREIQRSCPVFSPFDGGLVDYRIDDRHETGEVFAFLLDYRYGVHNHGIENKVEFGIMKNGKMYKTGKIMTKAAKPMDKEHSEMDYRTIRVLEAGEKIVLGLESKDMLDIYEFDLSNTWVNPLGKFQRIERYELKLTEIVWWL